MPSGYAYHEVIGSSGIYTVTLALKNSPTQNFCTCPAYTYAVMIAKSHVMVSKLRRKLALAESGRFVRNVRSEGYVLVPEGRERMRGETPDDNPAIA